MKASTGSGATRATQASPKKFGARVHVVRGRAHIRVKKRGPNISSGWLWALHSLDLDLTRKLKLNLRTYDT